MSNRYPKEVIEKIKNLANDLINAIEKKDQEQILSAQKILTAFIDQSWKHFDEQEILASDKAIARLFADATIKELPMIIQDPSNHAYIQKELKLMQNTISLL